MQALRCQARVQHAVRSVRVSGACSKRVQRLRPCKAEDSKAGLATEDVVPQTPLPEQPAASPAPAAAPTAPILVKGQGTAIITGAISLLFGVAYLVITAVLDFRGGALSNNFWVPVDSQPLAASMGGARGGGAWCCCLA